MCLSIVYTQNAQTRTTRGPRELAPKLPDCPAFTSMCSEAAVPQVAFFFLFFLFNEAAISGEGGGGVKISFCAGTQPAQHQFTTRYMAGAPGPFQTHLQPPGFLSTGSDSSARLMALMLRDSISSVYSVVCARQYIEREICRSGSAKCFLRYSF